MAEGGAFRSFTDGSDAYVEHYCTPCGEGDVKEEAVKYCPECDEYLCRKCALQHTRQKATKMHKLVDRKDAKQSGHGAKTKCRHHPDRDIEMYCGTHDMVYCLLCIATDHRNCQKVDKIEVNLTRTIDPAEITQLFDETTNVKGNLNELKRKQMKNLSTLEEQINSIYGHLEDIEEKMIKRIIKLKKDTKKSADEMYDTMKDELKSEISLVSRTIDELNESSVQLKSINSYSNEQKFIYLRMTKQTISDANRQNRSCTTSAINFKERPEVADFMKTVNTLGVVSKSTVSHAPRQYKVKSVKEVNVQHSRDNQMCEISDVCQLPDGRILLTDFDNTNVKMLDVQYNIIDSCDMKASPVGICCVSKNEVAVKTNNSKVHFISVTPSLSKTRCISLEDGRHYGMTFYNGKLWVSNGPKGINIYNTTGGLLRSVLTKQNGDNIFKYNVQHMAVSDDTVIVTDSSDGAVVLKEDGTIIRELRDSRLVNTCGVCVADDGTVFLCGWNSNNILMFSKDGKCLGELAEKDMTLSCPINMCYDRKKNSLIVVSFKSNTVKILELIH